MSDSKEENEFWKTETKPHVQVMFGGWDASF
jgi:hypothetical protein